MAPLIDPEMKVKFKENVGLLKRLMDAFSFARDEDVLVGIPQEASSRNSDGVSNVKLMYIHTNGSPVNGIPARPTIEPAIRDPANRIVLQKLLKGSLATAFTGNISGARSAKERAGMMAVNMIRARFGSASLAPNAPYTVMKKGSSAPLIDTGQLRNSITYVIRKK